MTFVGTGRFAHAQQAPASLTAVNSTEAGAVGLSWGPFPEVASYTVGWLAVEDYEANLENNAWLKYFAYSNVGDVQSWTVRRLTPGIDYWMIACESLNDVAPGATPQCTGWERLTITGAVCPVAEEPATSTPAGGTDYDSDNDGLIEIRSIDQLDAVRYDLDGDGASEDSTFAAAFPGAASGMGCPSGGCTGYELAADLDFGSTASAHGWEPIGYYNSDDDHAGFNAVFDGNDHTISNLYISRRDTDYIGLVGFTGPNSVIRRMRLASVSITGGSGVGGLVGNHNGTISDSYAYGTVSSADDFTGGRVGYNNGTISDSHSTATVSGGDDYTGGLVGHNADTGAITASHATGSVTNTGTYTGGLVGFNAGTIVASYATGEVSSPGHTGGLVGYSSGTVTASYATGGASSTGTEAYNRLGSDRRAGDVGGLVGHSSGTITASYATGSVFSAGGYDRCFISRCSRYDGAGGLVGDNVGTISASYATGSVSSRGYTNGGGLVGQNSSTVSTSYWDTETSGLTVSTGGTGVTTAQLQSPTGATGIYASWNTSWWDFGTSEQYPVLKVEGLSVAAQRP